MPAPTFVAPRRAPRRRTRSIAWVIARRHLAGALLGAALAVTAAWLATLAQPPL